MLFCLVLFHDKLLLPCSPALLPGPSGDFGLLHHHSDVLLHSCPRLALSSEWGRASFTPPSPRLPTGPAWLGPASFVLPFLLTSDRVAQCSAASQPGPSPFSAFKLFQSIHNAISSLSNSIMPSSSLHYHLTIDCFVSFFFLLFLVFFLLLCFRFLFSFVGVRMTGWKQDNSLSTFSALSLSLNSPVFISSGALMTQATDISYLG